MPAFTDDPYPHLARCSADDCETRFPPELDACPHCGAPAQDTGESIDSVDGDDQDDTEGLEWRDAEPLDTGSE